MSNNPTYISADMFVALPAGSLLDMFPQTTLTQFLRVPPPPTDQTLMQYKAPATYDAFEDTWALLALWIKDNLVLKYIDNYSFIYNNCVLPFKAWETITDNINPLTGKSAWPLQYSAMVTYPYKSFGAGLMKSFYGQSIIIPNYALTDVLNRFNIFYGSYN